MLKVIEVANKLGVSKVTIYKKMKKIKGFNRHLTKKQNITYIDEQGIEIIKNDLGKFKNHNSEKLLKEVWSEKANNLREYENELLKQCRIKESQLRKKDIQIENTKYLIKINKRRLRLLKEMISN